MLVVLFFYLVVFDKVIIFFVIVIVLGYKQGYLWMRVGFKFMKNNYYIKFEAKKDII